MNLEQENPSLQNIQINFDSELSHEQDEIFFKPVTRGLGFHQAESKKIKPAQRKNALHEQAKVEVRPFDHQASSKSRVDTHFPMQEKPVQPSPKTVKKYKQAKPAVQLLAWVIDVLIVTCLAIIITTLGAYFSNISILQASQSVDRFDLVAPAMLFFGFLYIVYFTLFDLNQSVGKNLLSIKLVLDNNEPVRVKNSVVRSMVTLFSLLALGLPSLLDFQGKLSDTHMIENES